GREGRRPGVAAQPRVRRLAPSPPRGPRHLRVPLGPAPSAPAPRRGRARLHAVVSRHLPARDALLGVLLSLVVLPDDVPAAHPREVAKRRRGTLDVHTLLFASRPDSRRAPGGLGSGPLWPAFSDGLAAGYF